MVNILLIAFLVFSPHVAGAVTGGCTDIDKIVSLTEQLQDNKVIRFAPEGVYVLAEYWDVYTFQEKEQMAKAFAVYFHCITHRQEFWTSYLDVFDLYSGRKRGQLMNRYKEK